MSRLGHTIRSLATATALAAATVTGTAIAQEETPAFTTANVLPRAPFGTLPIDRARIPEHMENLDRFLARLNESQRTELQQRCEVITANADTYQALVVGFCNAVLTATETAA